MEKSAALQKLKLCSTAVVSVSFVVSFYSADYLATLRNPSLDLSLSFEPIFSQSVPPSIATLLMYLSAFPFVGALLWWQGSAQQVQCWQRAMLIAMAVATTTFVVLPSVPLFSALPSPWSAELSDWLNRLTGQHNHFPSLHVGLTVVSLLTLARGISPYLRALAWVWGSVITLSTLLTWQHCVADVAGGVALGFVVVFVSASRDMRA